MNWGNTGDFLAMGGYGLYVWGSYAVVLIWMLGEPVLVARRHTKALAKVQAAKEEGY
jgi:heme exporter protein D